jgi:serine/threonine protein phosphatase PrpC
MKLSSTTHGLARKPGAESEDAFRVQQRDSRVIAVLADGLGSSKEGGTAARRAVDMMGDYYLARPQAWSPRRALTEFVTQINRVFHQESLLRHSTPELLCTLSVVVIENGRLYGINVGDSPVYLWRQGALTLLSQAHSMAQAGFQHVLTRAVGLEAGVEPAVFETDIEDGDLVLLCSDGVSTVLSDEKLATLLARRATARSLVTAAHEATEEHPELRDDASAIVLDIAHRGWTGESQHRQLEVLPALHAGDPVDDYRLVRPLQEGDRVWLAEKADGIRHVLKFPSIEARDDEVRRDAFIRELWQATRIDSPDFVRAFTPSEGTLRYYAMDFVEAPTLREVLQKGPIRVEDAVELGRFLLRAGQFLLTRDLAHGDLKPDNILVLGNEFRPRYQLIDLGSAAEVFSVTSRAGTPSYLAPERFHGAALSERSEIFAIGVTLYEALTQTYPYGEIERFQTPRFETAPKRPTRLNPAIPPWLESILLHALAPNSEDRYQNFSEIAYDFDHPENVRAYHRQDAPLLERNPLLLYKSLCFILLISNLAFLLYILRHRQ